MAKLFTLPNVTTGPDNILVGLTSSNPKMIIFPIMILAFVFLMVFLVGAMLQFRRNQYVDVPMWLVLGFLTVDLTALLMSTTPGLVNGVILGFCFGATILSGIWLFLSKGRFEN